MLHLAQIRAGRSIIQGDLPCEVCGLVRVTPRVMNSIMILKSWKQTLVEIAGLPEGHQVSSVNFATAWGGVLRFPTIATDNHLNQTPSQHRHPAARRHRCDNKLPLTCFVWSMASRR